jgi:hypothetical protein
MFLQGDDSDKTVMRMQGTTLVFFLQVPINTV